VADVNIEDDFIGSGWGFPPTFEKNSKSLKMVSGKKDIDESLHILLSTTVGERIMQLRYGCNLRPYVFEPMNASMQSYIKKLVHDAILYFEPRIRMENLSLDVEDGTMEITVEYTVKSTHSRYSYVFPFYLREGSQP